MPAQEEFLTNWGNHALTQSQNGQNILAAQVASDLQSRGYSASETADVMAADNFDIKTVEAAIKSVYNPKTATAATVSTPDVNQIQVVPTSYRDVSSIVESQLKALGSREFINRLARSKTPLMPVNDRTLQSYQRLAAQALNDRHAMACLHNDLKDWFEEAMYVSVCAAKSPKNDLKIAANKSGRYTVSNVRGASCEVCLHSGTCTCKRFQEGHFAEFGLACEHMVATADTISPHERLLHALSTKVENTVSASVETPVMMSISTITRA